LTNILSLTGQKNGGHGVTALPLRRVVALVATGDLCAKQNDFESLND